MSLSDSAIPASRPHLPALDGLRGVAILLVFALHVTRPFSEHMPTLLGPLRAIASVGWMGVDLFFVLSGFLITGILWDTRHDPRRYRNFYARRTLRIFPIYYLAVAGVAGWVAYQYVRGISIGNAVPSLALLATYTLNLGLAAKGWPAAEFAGVNVVHFWSLAIEEQFYLFWPAIVFGIKRRNVLIGVCIAAIVACPVLRTIFYYHCVSFDVLFNLTPLRVDSLAVGSLIALLLRGERVPRRWSAMEAAGVIGLITLAAFAVHYGRVTETKPGLITVGLTCVALFAGAVIRQVVVGGRLSRMLSVAPLVRLGKYSYGLYVYHWFVIQGTRACFPSRRMTVPEYCLFLTVVVTITLTVTLLSYRFIESPFLRLKRHFRPTAPGLNAQNG